MTILKLPSHIYKTTHPLTGDHLGYRVLFQKDEEITTKNFSFSKYADPLEAAKQYRLDNLDVRVKSTTGVKGVNKVKTDRPNYVYYSYNATWRLEGGTQRTRTFTYSTFNKRTGIMTYDADLEFMAFRCALHFRHIYLWYRDQGLTNEFEATIKRYKNLNSWYAFRPELIFLES